MALNAEYCRFFFSVDSQLNFINFCTSSAQICEFVILRYNLVRKFNSEIKSSNEGGGRRSRDHPTCNATTYERKVDIGVERLKKFGRLEGPSFSKRVTLEPRRDGFGLVF